MTSAKLQRLQSAAQAALSSGNWPATRKAFDKLIRAAPGHASLHYNRALVLKRLGQMAPAVSDLERALNLDAVHHNTRFELASAHLELGRLEEAEAGFSAYVEANPEDADGWLNLGRLRLRRGASEPARDALRRAHGVALSSDTALALAEAERECGDLDASLALLSEMDPSDPSVAAARLKVTTQGTKGRIRLDPAQLFAAPPSGPRR